MGRRGRVGSDEESVDEAGLRAGVGLAARGVVAVLVRYAVSALLFVAVAVMALLALQGLLLLGVAAYVDDAEGQFVGLVFLVTGWVGVYALRRLRGRLIDQGWALAWRRRRAASAPFGGEGDS